MAPLTSQKTADLNGSYQPIKCFLLTTLGSQKSGNFLYALPYLPNFSHTDIFGGTLKIEDIDEVLAIPDTEGGLSDRLKQDLVMLCDAFGIDEDEVGTSFLVTFSGRSDPFTQGGDDRIRPGLRNCTRLASG